MEESLPAVSVVIPVYDRHDHLPQAIESVLAQTYRGEIQVVVVDDGSPQPVADRLRDRFPTVRWLRQENRGVCAARQLGSDEADAPLIAYLDDDDLWHPDKLETQVRVLREHPEVDLVWCDVVFFREDWVSRPFYGKDDRMKLGTRRQLAGDPATYLYEAPTLTGTLIRHDPLTPQAILLRRSFLERIGGWRVSIRGCGDCHDITVRAAEGGTLAYQDAVLARIRRGHRHMTGDTLAAEYESLAVLTEQLPTYPEEAQERVRRPLARQLAGSGWKHYRKGRFQVAAAAYRRSARLDPRPKVLVWSLIALARAALVRGS